MPAYQITLSESGYDINRATSSSSDSSADMSLSSSDSAYDSDELLASSNHYTRCPKTDPAGYPHRRLLKLVRCRPQFHGFLCLQLEDHFDREPYIEHIDAKTLETVCSTCFKPQISDRCARLRCRNHCLALGKGCRYHEPKTTRGSDSEGSDDEMGAKDGEMGPEDKSQVDETEDCANRSERGLVDETHESG